MEKNKIICNTQSPLYSQFLDSNNTNRLVQMEQLRQLDVQHHQGMNSVKHALIDKTRELMKENMTYEIKKNNLRIRNNIVKPQQKNHQIIEKEQQEDASVVSENKTKNDFSLENYNVVKEETNITKQQDSIIELQKRLPENRLEDRVDPSMQEHITEHSTSFSYISHDVINAINSVFDIKTVTLLVGMFGFAGYIIYNQQNKNINNNRNYSNTEQNNGNTNDETSIANDQINTQTSSTKDDTDNVTMLHHNNKNAKTMQNGNGNILYYNLNGEEKPKQEENNSWSSKVIGVGFILGILNSLIPYILSKILKKPYKPKRRK